MSLNFSVREKLYVGIVFFDLEPRYKSFYLYGLASILERLSLEYQKLEIVPIFLVRSVYDMELVEAVTKMFSLRYGLILGTSIEQLSAQTRDLSKLMRIYHSSWIPPESVENTPFSKQLRHLMKKSHRSIFLIRSLSDIIDRTELLSVMGSGLESVDIVHLDALAPLILKIFGNKESANVRSHRRGEVQRHF